LGEEKLPFSSRFVKFRPATPKTEASALSASLLAPGVHREHLPVSDVNPHYLDHVVKLSETSDIEASEDIVSGTGMKLLAKGAKIDARARERLLEFRLTKPLENMCASSAAPTRRCSTRSPSDCWRATACCGASAPRFPASTRSRS
jgi:hypothetical protein